MNSQFLSFHFQKTYSSLATLPIQPHKMTLVPVTWVIFPLFKPTSQTPCDLVRRTQNYQGRIPPQSAQSEIGPGEATM